MNVAFRQQSETRRLVNYAIWWALLVIVAMSMHVEKAASADLRFCAIKDEIILFAMPQVSPKSTGRSGDFVIGFIDAKTGARLGSGIFGSYGYDGLERRLCDQRWTLGADRFWITSGVFTQVVTAFVTKMQLSGVMNVARANCEAGRNTRMDVDIVWAECCATPLVERSPFFDERLGYDIWPVSADEFRIYVNAPEDKFEPPSSEGFQGVETLPPVIPSKGFRSICECRFRFSPDRERRGPRFVPQEVELAPTSWRAKGWKLTRQIRVDFQGAFRIAEASKKRFIISGDGTVLSWDPASKEPIVTPVQELVRGGELVQALILDADRRQTWAFTSSYYFALDEQFDFLDIPAKDRVQGARHDSPEQLLRFARLVIKSRGDVPPIKPMSDCALSEQGP